MKNPAFPGLALFVLGMGILVYYALSVVKTERGGTAFGLRHAESSSSAVVPIPLAAGWAVMTGGIAWLVAGPRAARV